MPDLVQLERDGWAAVTGGYAISFYRDLLTDNATVLLPDNVLDRDAALRYWDELAPWSNWRLFSSTTMRLSATVAAVSYRAIARSADHTEPYMAACTSVYVRKRGVWRLAFHQQHRVT